MTGSPAATFELIIPPPKTLTDKEELALFRAALERNPKSLQVRYTLASHLLKANYFDELLRLCEVPEAKGYRWAELRVQALMAHETHEADVLAHAVSLKALEDAENDSERARLLTMLAKTQMRLGELGAARESLCEALALDAHEKDAYKRTVAVALRENKPGEVLEHAKTMIANGVAHARVLCSQSIALASLGMVEEARRASGIDHFLTQVEPKPPEGWGSLEAFNRALAEEVSAHPDTRFERYGTASQRTWRIDEPAIKRTPLLPVLQQVIAREIRAFAAALPEIGSPFVTNRPAQAWLRNWCVITGEDGHETWHVHQNGWLSGVYYIQIPDHIANGTDKRGCIAFGVPEDEVGAENAAAFGEVVCRPRTGLMMMFPSHLHHRTYPHGGEGRRICFAFDVVPAAARS